MKPQRHEGKEGRKAGRQEGRKDGRTNYMYGKEQGTTLAKQTG